MSKKGFERLPTDEDWDDDDSPFVEAESHVVSVSRGGSRKRYCKSKLCMYDVIKKQTNNTHKQLLTVSFSGLHTQLFSLAAHNGMILCCEHR